jgi:uncharacterized protein YjdB
MKCQDGNQIKVWLASDTLNNLVAWDSDQDSITTVVKGKVTAHSAGTAFVGVITADRDFT